MVDYSNPTTSEELRKTLGDVIFAAYANGVNISGEGFVVRNDDNDVDFEIEIHPISGNDRSD